METGGTGGNSNPISKLNFSGAEKTFGQSGCDGERAEDCGLVNINDNVTVYAYGGGGASGGLFTKLTGSSGTGAGGYPAARNWSEAELAGGRRRP